MEASESTLHEHLENDLHFLIANFDSPTIAVGHLPQFIYHSYLYRFQLGDQANKEITFILRRCHNLFQEASNDEVLNVIYRKETDHEGGFDDYKRTVSKLEEGLGNQSVYYKLFVYLIDLNDYMTGKDSANLRARLLDGIDETQVTTIYEPDDQIKFVKKKKKFRYEPRRKVKAGAFSTQDIFGNFILIDKLPYFLGIIFAIVGSIITYLVSEVKEDPYIEFRIAEPLLVKIDSLSKVEPWLHLDKPEFLAIEDPTFYHEITLSNITSNQMFSGVIIETSFDSGDQVLSSQVFSSVVLDENMKINPITSQGYGRYQLTTFHPKQSMQIEVISKNNGPMKLKVGNAAKIKLIQASISSFIVKERRTLLPISLI